MGAAGAGADSAGAGSLFSLVFSALLLPGLTVSTMRALRLLDSTECHPLAGFRPSPLGGPACRGEAYVEDALTLPAATLLLTMRKRLALLLQARATPATALPGAGHVCGRVRSVCVRACVRVCVCVCVLCMSVCVRVWVVWVRRRHRSFD